MKVFTSLLLFLSACAPVLAEFESLFDGKSLDGWVIENGGQFEVKDGKIRVNRGVGWLRSEETFGDFTLVLEVRFLEEDANSGIFVRTKEKSNEDENGWPANGYQIQCRDTLETATPFGAMINYGGPKSVDVLDREALKKAYRPTGDWHRCVIHCEGDRLVVLINGKVITESTGVMNAPGHVGIQAEHGLLEFRRIEVLRH